MRCKIIKTGWDQSLKWVKTAHFSYMVCVSLKCKNENFTEKFVNQKLNKFHFYCNSLHYIWLNNNYYFF